MGRLGWRGFKDYDKLSWFKGAWSYFSKFSFLFHLKNHHFKDVNWEFQLKWSSHLDARSRFVYCSCQYFYCVSLIMVTITRHIFINIFQMEHFSAVKFAMGYEKNMSYHVISKSPKVWKSVEKIGMGSFKTSRT